MQKLLQIFVSGLMTFNSLKIVELCNTFLQYFVMTFNSSNFETYGSEFCVTFNSLKVLELPLVESWNFHRHTVSSFYFQKHMQRVLGLHSYWVIPC